MADQTYSLAMRNPILSANPVYAQYNQQPTTRLTLEQQAYQQPLHQPPSPMQSDPYTDYISVLQSTTDVTRDKIIQDERYIQIYSQCELALKQYLYSQVIPQVVQSQQGRILFEQLHATTRTLKDEYTQLEIQKEREAADMEKRLTEREHRLEEKERQIDEMLKKISIAQTHEDQSPKNSNKLPYNHGNKGGDSRGKVNE